MDNKKRSIKAVIVSALFTVLFFYYYYIDVYLSGWLVALAMLAISVSAILFIYGLITEPIRLFRNRKVLSLGSFLPLIIYLTFLFLPIGEVEDSLSPVKFRACYEGTQNQTVLYFHTDHTFRRHATGVFGYSSWGIGKWQQKKDTIVLTWDRGGDERLGHTLLIDSGYLKTLDNTVDARFKAFPMFYLGYCKGEN